MTVDGRVADRASMPTTTATVVEVHADTGHVGRGAEKLEAAFAAWPGIPVRDEICLDMGASTGGFTQVLLERGAAHVYAIDVGHGQLARTLAEDPRVTNVEGLNIRDLDTGRLPEPEIAQGIRLAVGDVSFISLTLVVPVVARKTAVRHCVVLVKPQFEVGREHLERGGVVTDPDLWRHSLARVSSVGSEVGLQPVAVIASPLAGKSGNREFLLWMMRGATPPHRREWETRVEAAVASAEAERTIT